MGQGAFFIHIILCTYHFFGMNIDLSFFQGAHTLSRKKIVWKPPHAWLKWMHSRAIRTYTDFE